MSNLHILKMQMIYILEGHLVPQHMLSSWMLCVAALFLLWELSTPCVYARWFLYNLNLANTRLYIGNGLAMLATFFLARNVLGFFMAIDFFKSSGRELAHPR